jgi:hypothetical protein
MVPLFYCIFHNKIIVILVYVIHFLSFTDTMVKIKKSL